MSAEARGFGDALGRALGVPVAYLDEGLSSWAAEDDLRARGGSLEKARKGGLVDQRVAMGLLRAWLDDLERRPRRASRRRTTSPSPKTTGRSPRAPPMRSPTTSPPTIGRGTDDRPGD